MKDLINYFITATTPVLISLNNNYKIAIVISLSLLRSPFIILIAIGVITFIPLLNAIPPKWSFASSSYILFAYRIFTYTICFVLSILNIMNFLWSKCQKSNPQPSSSHFRGWFNFHYHKHQHNYMPKPPQSKFTYFTKFGFAFLGLGLTAFASYNYHRAADAAAVMPLLELRMLLKFKQTSWPLRNLTYVILKRNKIFNVDYKKQTGEIEVTL